MSDFKLYKYPMNKNVFVTNETVLLTPKTFYPNGQIWEFNEIDLFFSKVLSHPNKAPIIVDIGAQTGLYTLFASFVPDASFYSYEPFVPCYNELNKNIALNNITNVKTFNIAISDKTEKKMLKVPVHKGLSTFGDNPLRFQDYKEVEVECDTLDNIFYEKNIPVDFIKCDTEGWEYFVLLGGLKTIEKYHPVLQLEYHHTNMSQCGINKQDFDKLIEKIGYVCTVDSGEEHIYEYMSKSFERSDLCIKNDKFVLSKFDHVYIDVGLSWNAPNSIEWCKHVPNALVFGFEPNPTSIKSVKNFNIAAKDSQKFYLIPVALGNQEGILPFYNTTNDVGTSSLFKPKTQSIGPSTIINVHIMTLMKFFDHFPWEQYPFISYLKIDAQGSDLNVIKGAGKYLEKIVYVTAETDGHHYHGSDDNNEENIVKYMESMDFTRVNHNYTKDPTFINNKLRHLENKIFIYQKN